MEIINAIAKGVLSFAKDNAGPITTGAVVLGMVTAFVLSARAGEKAAEDFEEMKEELEVEELTFGEKVKASWKRFLPSVFVLLMTLTCFVYTTNRMMKRYAALSAAYSITENYLRDYIDETKRIAGPKKEQMIRDDVSIKQAERAPTERGIIETGYGDDLFYDAVITSRYFRSNMEHVKTVVRELNNQYQAEDELKVRDYTYGVGLAGFTNTSDYLGWRKTGHIDGTEKFSLYFTSSIYEPTGEPYIIINQDANWLTDLRLF